jgi:hypothetical protein
VAAFRSPGGQFRRSDDPRRGEATHLHWTGGKPGGDQTWHKRRRPLHHQRCASIQEAKRHLQYARTVAAARAGDPSARARLGQYLVGKPAATARAPVTVVVQQLSGRDPLVDRLAEPHINRTEYPSLHADDDFKDGMRELIAGELRALEAHKSNTPEIGAGRVVGTTGATTRKRHQTVTAFWTCGAGRGKGVLNAG